MRALLSIIVGGTIFQFVFVYVMADWLTASLVVVAMYVGGIGGALPFWVYDRWKWRRYR